MLSGTFNKQQLPCNAINAHSLLLTAPRHLQWITETLPTLQYDEVLVQTTTGAISIGAELAQFRGTYRGSHAAHFPRMTGYESVGIILACGEAVQNLHVGQRIVSFYGHRTYAIIPATKAIPVPDNISDTLAILAILTCDASKGIYKVAPQPDEAVLITGAGAIGLLTLVMLKARGIQQVDVVEPNEHRRELATLLGARRAMDSTEAQLSEPHYPIGIECSSYNTAFTLLQNKVRQNGRLCILADGNIEPLVLTPDFHEKELIVIASSDGLDYQQHARWFFSHVLPEQSQLLEKLFEYEITAHQLIDTFERLASGTISPIKVLVHYEQ